MSLCFSPTGESFKNVKTKFPAIINNTVIDWFHPWSEEALLSVSTKFTEELDLSTNEFRHAVVNFMPYSFKVVTEASEKFYKTENRRIHTTPKSFLEFINQFKIMFKKTKGKMEADKKRYELGVIKLNEALESVAKLEEDLKNHQAQESVKENANKYANKIDLAQRMMSSLRSETERWEAAISTLNNKLKVIIGDVLLSAAFVSYVGPFNKDFRDKIIQDKFIPFFHDNQIQISQGSNPISILTDEATIIEWNN